MRFILAILITVFACSTLAGAGSLSNRRAPGFALPDPAMKYYDLADYRGKVVLLDIMKTDCPACMTLAETLKGIKEKYADKVVVLTVVAPPDNHKTVVDFATKHGISTPILLDCGQMIGSYLLPSPQRPRVHLPHLFLIDAKGMIRNDFDSTNLPVFEGEGLDEEIDRLLKEVPGAK